ncbi:MAG: hypothetical protein AAFR61_02525 [Bacteroidota bacterium]
MKLLPHPAPQRLLPAGFLLLSPGFLWGLSLLILNDWWWKDAYPGFWTGKLSDLAGLFILPIFLSAFWPRHFRWHLAFTALLFCFWNAPVSQGLIAWGQGIGIPFHRTSDLTDYGALLILPFSWLYLRPKLASPPVDFRRPLSLGLALCGLFFLTATTVRPQFGTYVDKTYEISLTNQELLEELESWDAELAVDTLAEEAGAYVLMNLKMDGEAVLQAAQFVLTEQNGKSLVHLKQVMGVQPIYPFYVWQNGSRFKRQAKRYMIRELRKTAP